jgi:hypothetical protein
VSGHSHHQEHRQDVSRAFALGILLNAGIVAVELVYGFLGNSMALIADGGHNLSDVLGLVIAWAGAMMAKSSPSPRFTYGLKKASILAALINALLLLVALLAPLIAPHDPLEQDLLSAQMPPAWMHGGDASFPPNRRRPRSARGCSWGGSRVARAASSAGK